MHSLNQQIEKKEKVVRQMETQQKRIDHLNQFSKDMMVEAEAEHHAPPGLIAQDRGTSQLWRDSALLKNTMSNKD